MLTQFLVNHRKSGNHWMFIYKNVAELARGFTSAFEAEEWGYLVSLWHDLEKYSKAFQSCLGIQTDYHQEEVSFLNGKSRAGPKVDHSSAGAQHAVNILNVKGHLLAYPISGHHAGLFDAINDGPCLGRRLKKELEPWRQGLQKLPKADIPELPLFLKKVSSKAGYFSVAFFVRMLFSCLVDADFLDTECFLDKKSSLARPRWEENPLDRMEHALTQFVERLQEVDGKVNQKRAEVRKACLSAAKRAPDLFSLTVPAGGGKTLSSLAFAIRHAISHGLKRIIYVIPFTSIIGQNADVFRKVFEPLVKEGALDPVVEHHSAFDIGKKIYSRLAGENWDAPLIGTTSVQFYQSLFHNRPSKWRKLHNLARSVIILDECQKIPVDYLRPCLYASKELATNFGSTVALCTATQPAIKKCGDFSIGLDGVREIVPDPTRLYLALKRVRIETIGLQTDEELAKRIGNHGQVLCIVTTRQHARELYDHLQGEGNVAHLSAAMCPEHRACVLKEVKQRVEAGEPCRVISTQLVEAGVDLDFPVVYRSLAGLDSIAEAVGRCNRNGLLATEVT